MAMAPHHPVMHCASEVQLIDHLEVDWDTVQRTRYWMDQRFVYRYPGRVRELRQRLIVVPPDRYAEQRLATFHLQVSQPEATTTARFDQFGNRVFDLYIPQVDEEVTFETGMIVERRLDKRADPRVSPRQALSFLTPTPLTEADAKIASVARDLAARHPHPEAFANAVNAWVYESMRYGHGCTDVTTTAAEALRIGCGLCQDYAHIMLALCRAGGVPARYVSGHMLGEGGSHAWVEVLLRGDHHGYRAVAFDPTNHRRTTPAYITVAVGRDYRDVSPTSGSFIAPYAGHLETSKRAGLTELQYR